MAIHSPLGELEGAFNSPIIAAVVDVLMQMVGRWVAIDDGEKRDGSTKESRGAEGEVIRHDAHNGACQQEAKAKYAPAMIG